MSDRPGRRAGATHPAARAERRDVPVARASDAPGPPILVGTQPGSTTLLTTSGHSRSTAMASVVTRSYSSAAGVQGFSNGVDRTNHWAGQAAVMATAEPAGDIVTRMCQEARHLLPSADGSPVKNQPAPANRSGR